MTGRHKRVLMRTGISRQHRDTYVVNRPTTHVFSEAAAPSGTSVSRRTGSGGSMPGVRGTPLSLWDGGRSDDPAATNSPSPVP